MKYFKNGMTSVLHLEKLPTEETDEGLLSKVSKELLKLDGSGFDAKAALS
jgi:hypothetical protein